jgi:hypothetical protein
MQACDFVLFVIKLAQLNVFQLSIHWRAVAVNGAIVWTVIIAKQAKRLFHSRDKKKKNKKKMIHYHGPEASVTNE